MYIIHNEQEAQLLIFLLKHDQTNIGTAVYVYVQVQITLNTEAAQIP